MWHATKNYEFTKKKSEKFKLDFDHLNNSKDLHQLMLKLVPDIAEFTGYHMLATFGSTFLKIWIMKTLLGSSNGM